MPSTSALNDISYIKVKTAWLELLGLFHTIFIFCLTHKSRTGILLKKEKAKEGRGVTLSAIFRGKYLRKSQTLYHFV